jgi:hypothetical protein
MTGATAVHIVSKGDLAQDRRPADWSDPEGIATISRAKREAMLANPFVGGDDDPVQLVGTRDDRVIGRMDVIPSPIDTPAGPLRCLWGSAFFVPEEERATLMGVTLVLRLERLGETTGAAGASRLAYPLYEKLGYLDLRLPRYILLRHSRPLVDRFIRNVTAAVGAAAVDLALTAQHGVLAGAKALKTRGLSARRAHAFPPELEERLEATRAPVTPHRSAAWFEWLLGHTFFDDEEHRRELFLVVDEANEVVAYFLVKARRYDRVTDREFKNVWLGSLHDWMIFEPRALGFPQVVLLAIAATRSWKLDAFEVCLPHDVPRLDLRRWGFLPAGVMHVLVKPARGSVLADPELQRPARWRVRPGEGDYTFS